MKRTGDRARFAIDRRLFRPETLVATKMETLAEAPMTLEEMFVALTGEPDKEMAA